MARMRPGFITGEYANFGHFPQCLQLNLTHQIARYHWPLPLRGNTTGFSTLPTNSWLTLLHNVHNFMYFETFVHGYCVPRSCSRDDVDAAFRRNNGILVEFAQHEQDNVTKNLASRLSRFMIASLIAVAICCTIANRFTKLPKTLAYFDMNQNSREIMVLSSKGDASRLQFISGIRLIYSVTNFFTHFLFDTAQFSRVSIEMRCSKQPTIHRIPAYSFALR